MISRRRRRRGGGGEEGDDEEKEEEEESIEEKIPKSLERDVDPRTGSLQNNTQDQKRNPPHFKY